MQKELVQGWNDVEFFMGHQPGARHDLIVSDSGKIASVVTKVLGQHQNSGSVAEKFALNELKKKAANATDHKDQPTLKTLTVPYEAQGCLCAVIYSGTSEAYFAQECIRKAFASLLVSECEENHPEDLLVNVNLRGLKDSLAKEIIAWIATLAVVVRYRPNAYGKKALEQKPFNKLKVAFDTALDKKVAGAAIEEGRILGFCNNQVKYLADLPSNHLHPKTYREIAEQTTKGLPKVTSAFLDKKQLLKRNAGAFLAVVRADHHDRAGILHLNFKGSKSKKKLALVGKGVCFDTGGYNVKTGESMLSMHRDMTGSAVVLSLFRAMVELDVPYEVNAYLALAENLISHEAYRPNDVVVASNGMSIEVIDTDAEGRMVLSDTLVLASEAEPDLILDFATLTGSIVRSIDTRRCGVYSNNARVARLAGEAGDLCGERVWNFPIEGDYDEALKSDIADIRQCASSSLADHIYAATFLSKFIGKVKGKSIPWLHMDLAADTNKGGLGLIPTDTTGFGVRFGYELANRYLK